MNNNPEGLFTHPESRSHLATLALAGSSSKDASGRAVVTAGPISHPSPKRPGIHPAPPPTFAINSFPPEILSEIHLQVVRLYEIQEDATREKFNLKHYQWIPVLTHVCSLWRQIALGNPQLWSRLATNTDSELLEEVLNRSKDVPLHIVAYHDLLPKRVMHLWLLLRSLIKRTQSLDLRFKGFKLPSKFLNFEARAPLLRSLMVVDIGSADPSESNLSDLLNRQMPLLTRLEVYNRCFVWEPQVFRPTFKHLHLGAQFQGWSLPHTRWPTWEDMYAAFNAMPHLESLLLDNVMPVITHIAHLQDISLGHNTCYLKHLRHLQLMGTALQCSEFLRRVSFPRTASVEIQMKARKGARDLLDAFEPSVRYSFDSPDSSSAVSSSNNITSGDTNGPYQTLSVIRVNDRSVTLQAWAHLIPLTAFTASDLYLKSSPDYAIHPQNSLSISIEAESFDPTGIAESMIRAVPLDSVRHLSLSNLPEPSSSLWTSVIASRIPKLQGLRVEGTETSLFLPEALRTNQVRNPVVRGASHTHLVFPELKTIVFEEVDMKAWFPFPMIRPNPPPPNGLPTIVPLRMISRTQPSSSNGKNKEMFPEVSNQHKTKRKGLLYYKRFGDALRSRQQSGLRLDAIILKNCVNVDQKVLNRLNSMVTGPIQWDSLVVAGTGGNDDDSDGEGRGEGSEDEVVERWKASFSGEGARAIGRLRGRERSISEYCWSQEFMW